jgi:hypothetical protein
MKPQIQHFLKLSLNVHSETHGRKVGISFPVERIARSSIARKAWLFADDWLGNIFAAFFDCAVDIVIMSCQLFA